MRRTLLLCLLTVVCLAPLAATAETSRPNEPSREELTALETQLRAMLSQLTNLEDVSPVFRRHRKNLYSLTFRLQDSQNRRLARELAQGQKVRLLAVGQQGSIPSNPGFVSNAVLLSPASILNFWWAVYNPAATDSVNQTRVTVKGAGRSFLGQTEDLVYEAGSITMHWEGKSVSLEKPGVYTHRVKVNGGGSRKTQFLVP